MKKLILTMALAFTGLIASAQNTYSNNTTPGSQGTQPYNGTNPAGQPNQVPSYSVDPKTTQPLTPTVSPVNPLPNSTSPVVPNTTSPVNPIPPTTPNKEN